MRYHRDGLGARDIAKRLAMTESGVDKLLQRARLHKRIERKSRSDVRQIEMFPETLPKKKA